MKEKALVGAFSVITNLRMELFQALMSSPAPGPGCCCLLMLNTATGSANWCCCRLPRNCQEDGTLNCNIKQPYNFENIDHVLHWRKYWQLMQIEKRVHCAIFITRKKAAYRPLFPRPCGQLFTFLFVNQLEKLEAAKAAWLVCLSLLSLTGSFLVLLGLSESFWVKFYWPYQALLSFTGPYLALLSLT